MHMLCDCPEGQDPMKASITINRPEGSMRMTSPELDLAIWITCTHCGKILKPPYLRRSDMPGRDWETFPMNFRE